MRRIALSSLALAVSCISGAGLAKWAMADVNGFYMTPAEPYGLPAYARAQPVADSFWQAQDGSDATPPAGLDPATAGQAGATSTAISAQPAYFSASGS